MSFFFGMLVGLTIGIGLIVAFARFEKIRSSRRSFLVIPFHVNQYPAFYRGFLSFENGHYISHVFMHVIFLYGTFGSEQSALLSYSLFLMVQYDRQRRLLHLRGWQCRIQEKFYLLSFIHLGLSFLSTRRWVIHHKSKFFPSLCLMFLSSSLY